MQIISKHTRGRNYTIKRKGGKESPLNIIQENIRGANCFHL